MNSQTIKAAFAEAGIKVRVKALRGNRFRICRLNDEAHDKAASVAVCASLGLKDSGGKLGGDFNQAHEMTTNA